MNQEIEGDIQAKASVGPRVTPADIEAEIVGEYYFTAKDGTIGAGALTCGAVERFLSWPVPASCYPDGTHGQPGRTGTNLLSASEAADMLTHVLVVPGAAPELALLTFCVLVLKNGFTVTGESACASPENFNAEIGRKVARQKAVEKIWPLLGFRLRDRRVQETEIIGMQAQAAIAGIGYAIES